MIVRTAQKGDAASEAVYSDDMRHRYLLTRGWAPGSRVLFVMLNPSTATEAQNDPSVERCERRARVMGHGAFRVCNIFALRETDPRKMRADPEPVGGPDNDRAIAESCLWADVIVCAWGSHGAHLGRGAAVERLMRATGRELHHLGLTRDGHPRHPLYIAYGTRPELWPAPA